jgi:hypothetical protein
MSDRTFVLFVGLALLASSVSFAARGRREGRCQSACWLAGYTYVSTDATACLCDGAGMPVAVAVPKAP